MRKIEMEGKRFGKLVVLARVLKPRVAKYIHYLCQCDCGKSKEILGYSLREGKTKSCGCGQAPFIHGYTKDNRYQTWKHMWERCNNPKHKSWEQYGGRGISICPEWKDFTVFVSDMGEKPSISHSIDRIDNSGNYTPCNCRWATKLEQVRNRRINKRNASGYSGVFRDHTKTRWKAAILVDGRQIHLGYYNSVDEAIADRIAAELKYWGKEK